MKPTRRTLPLVLLVLVGIALGVVLTWGGGGDEEEDVPLAPTPENAARESHRGGTRNVDLIPPPAVQIVNNEPTPTTVLWPLRIELDLLQADYLPTEQGVLPVGSGASAKLFGRITDRKDLGARAEIHFIAGTNQGRVLHTDATGRFGAADLYPGLAIVDVRGKGLLGSRREIRLRQRVTTQLNIGYGRPGSMSARVQDTKGEPVQGATVTVDGVRVVSGIDGGVFIDALAAGQVLVEVECAGYSAHKELVPITGGRMLPSDQATFTLKQSATLTLNVTDRVGGPGPVLVVLLPSQMEQTSDMSKVQRSTGYPWHRINPIEVWPGQPRKVEGLPAAVVKVYAFRAGAFAPQRVVTLREGRNQSVALPLTPAPKIVGIVRKDGKPVAGARVHLEAPDRVRATLGYFREQSFFLESAVMPELPAAVQEVETDREGRFVLTAWSDVAQVRFLEAIGPDNKTWAGRLVHPEDEIVNLDLEEVKIANSSLLIDFPGRWQGLPIEVLIDGQPFDPIVLPPLEELPIKDLRGGKWRMQITWNGDPILVEESFSITGATTREIVLPPEAIEGQNEEQWRRAGRAYPL